MRQDKFLLTEKMGPLGGIVMILARRALGAPLGPEGRRHLGARAPGRGLSPRGQLAASKGSRRRARGRELPLPADSGETLTRSRMVLPLVGGGRCYSGKVSERRSRALEMRASIQPHQTKSRPHKVGIETKCQTSNKSGVKRPKSLLCQSLL